MVPNTVLRFSALTLFLLLSSSVAAKKASSFEDKQAAWQDHRALEQSSDFQGLAWRSIGPISQGGRLVDIESIPGKPYSFLVGYASGGVWRTDNNGGSFQPLSDQLPSMIVGDLAIDPNQPSTYWLGTGENNSSRSSYGGMGVYRSDDAGENWRYMGLGESNRIGRIIVHPKDSATIYVATLGPLYTENGARGIYKSSDGGNHWTQVLAGDRKTGFIELIMDPSNPNRLYAVSWQRFRSAWNFEEGGEGSGIWKTENAGTDWTRISGGLPTGAHVGRIGLAIAPSQSNTLYASVDNQRAIAEKDWSLGHSPLSAKRLLSMTKDEFLTQDPDEIGRFIEQSDLESGLTADLLIKKIESDELSVQQLLDELTDANANLFETDIQGLELWRSDDAGKTWAKTHEQALDQLVYTYGYYFGQIAVANDNPDKVFLLGVPIVSSSDGGKEFISNQAEQVHGDYQAIWIDPHYPQRMIVGNDGGMDISYDGGGTWRSMDAQAVGQFYTITVDMAEPYNILGGLQDNGTWKVSSQSQLEFGDRWSKVWGGDGMAVNVDVRDNETLYAGYQFGFYSRINSDGSQHSVRPKDAIGEEALRYNWNTPVALSPHNNDIVYFGTQKLFRSMDKGETWTALSDDLTSSPNRGNVPYATISTLSESPLVFSRLWVGTDDGNLWLTPDGGVSWKKQRKNLPKNRWVSRVHASQHKEDRAYVSFNGYRNDDDTAYVYVTDDLGAHWRSISKGLPNEAVNVIREDPVNENLLYIGSDRGVYVSLDRGKTWQSLQANLPNVPVHDLIIHPREGDLIAATHGRSVWSLNVSSLQTLDDTITKSPLHIFEIDEQKQRPIWRQPKNRWVAHLQANNPLDFYVWSKIAASATLQVTDALEQIIYTEDIVVVKGVNHLQWNWLLDETMAIDSERNRLEQMPETPLPGSKGYKQHIPLTEAKRLGRPMYIVPGDYHIKISSNQHSSSTELQIIDASK